MIAFDFEYYKPDSINEALITYKTLNENGKKVLYYGGGTEFISMARMNTVHADAVIDIKGIPECNILKLQNHMITIGSGNTLTQIVRADLFPLLSMSARRVADHTMQGKITIGGNLCGTIIYKEAILPLLLSDCNVVIGSINNPRTVPINEIFNEKINLGEGEFIIQIIVDEKYKSLLFAHAKSTKQDKIDYPLITLASMKVDDRVRIAFSGLCQFPFRSYEIENDLNNITYSLENRIDNLFFHLPGDIIDDDIGSRDYRKFVLRNLINKLNKHFRE